MCSKKTDKKFGQRGPGTSRSTARVSESKDSAAFLARDIGEEIWYVDAGATEHMSNNRAAFINFKEISKGTWHVAIANEQNLWMLGKGDIKIKRRAHDKWLDGTLHDVPYIPDLRTNLFSVGRVADKRMVTIYRKNTCQMIGDNGERDILLTGIHTGTSLYKLQVKAVITSEENSCAYQVTTSEGSTSTKVAEDPSKQGERRIIKTPKKDNIELWHHKFCHINTNTLRQTEQAVRGMLIQDK